MVQKSGLIIISLFVAVLIGVVFSGIVGDISFSTSRVGVSTNESRTFVAGSALLSNANIRNLGNIDASTVTLKNNSNVTINSNNFNAFANGSVILLAGATGASGQGTTPTLNTSYSFFDENYVKDSTSRTLLSPNILVLFFVLAMLIGMLVWLRNNTGLFDGFGGMFGT